MFGAPKKEKWVLSFPFRYSLDASDMRSIVHCHLGDKSTRDAGGTKLLGRRTPHHVMRVVRGRLSPLPRPSSRWPSQTTAAATHVATEVAT